MDLDVSHLTGRRRWSDRDLLEAIDGGHTWADVLRALDVTDNAEARVRIKGHATRVGLDVSHLREVVPEKAPLSARPADLRLLRVAAPAIATAWFELRGCPVAVPLEPQEYDLLVSMPKGIQRVQVKSASGRDRDGKWQVSVGRRPYSLDKTAGKAPYDPDSIDHFFIVNGAGGLYLIPSAVVAGRLGIVLEAYAPYRVGDASSLLR